MDYTVYIHVSPSDKRYIGITKTKLCKRWANGKGYRNNKYFTRAIEKYGWDNFQHIIVAKGLTKEEAQWLEIELIKEWDSTNRDKGYNITKGGESANGLCGGLNGMFNVHRYGEEAPMFGKQHSEETRRKMSESHSGDNSSVARAIILLNTKEVFSTIEKGAEEYNIHRSDISRCCRCDEYNSAGKMEDGTPLVWMYYDEYLNITEEEAQMKIENADFRVICITTNEIFLNSRYGAEKYNISKANISQCCNGSRYKSVGKHPITGEKLVWMYYKDYLKLTVDK